MLRILAKISRLLRDKHNVTGETCRLNWRMTGRGYRDNLSSSTSSLWSGQVVIDEGKARLVFTTGSTPEHKTFACRCKLHWFSTGVGQ